MRTSLRVRVSPGGGAVADQIPERKRIGLASGVMCRLIGMEAPACRLQDILGVNEERDAIRH